jgi:hypothetical protein
LLARQHQSRSSNETLLFQTCPEMVTDPDRLIIDTVTEHLVTKGAFSDALVERRARLVRQVLPAEV